jgi:glyoxylase I family protein
MKRAQQDPAAAIRVTGIDHVVLRVKDLAKMLDFYTRVLGCRLERSQDEIGLYQLRAGTSLIDLVTVEGKLGAKGGAAPGPGGRNMDHLCLRLADFDAARIKAHLQHHGVAIGEEGVRYGAAGEAPSLYLTDPEGNGLELRA